MIFAVATLYLLVGAFLYFSLENTCTLGFVEVGNFKYLGSVHPRIRPPLHDCYVLAIELIYGYARVAGLSDALEGL